MKNKTSKARRILTIIGIIAVILILFSLIFHHLIWLIFCNLTAKVNNPNPVNEWTSGSTYTGVMYADDSDSQYLDLYVPDTNEPAPLFVLIHGGGFVCNDARSDQARYMYEYFRDHGYACATINYRLASEEPFPGAISDCKAAIRYLAANADQYGFDASRIAVWGESAGGYLACSVTLSPCDEFSDVLAVGETADARFAYPDISALVDFYGCMDFMTASEEHKELNHPKFIMAIANSYINSQIEDYDSCEAYWLRKDSTDWTEEDETLTSIYNQAQRGASDHEGLQTIIYHGNADITVPHLQSVNLAEVLTNLYGSDSVRLNLMRGMIHGDNRLYKDENLADVDAFLQDALN